MLLNWRANFERDRWAFLPIFTIGLLFTNSIMGWRMLPLLLGFLWLCPAGSADSQRAPKLPGMPDVNRRQAGEPIAVEAHHGAELVYLERRMLANSGSLEEYGTQRVGGRWLRGSLAPGAGRLAEPPPPPPPTDFSKLPNFEIGVPAPPALQIWEWQRQQQLLGVRDPPLELSSSSFVQPGEPLCAGGLAGPSAHSPAAALC